MDVSKTALMELIYNTIGNNIENLKRQYNLDYTEMAFVVTRIMQDLQTKRLVEVSNDVMQLTQKINGLEEEAKKHDESDTSA